MERVKMSASKTIIKIGLLTIAIFAVLLIALNYVFDENRYKIVLQEQLNKMTGVKIVLDGPMDISFFPLPHVSLKDVKLNIDIGKNKALTFQVKALSFALPWKSFFEDIKEISDIQAQSILVNYDDNKNQGLSLFFEHFEGDIINTMDKLDVPEFELSLGNNKIKGDVVISFANNQTDVKGNLETQQWQSFVSSSHFGATDKAILNKILHDQWLKQVNVDLKVKINKLILKDDTLKEAKFAVTIKDNRLTVVYKGKIAAIEHSGKVTLQNSENNKPLITVDFKVNDPEKTKNMEGVLKALYETDSPQVKVFLKLAQLKIPVSDNNPSSNRFFLTEFISFDRLQALNADFVIQAVDVLIGTIPLQNITFEAKFKKNEIKLTSKGQFKNGEQVSHFDIKFNEKQPDVSLDAVIDLKNADASEVMKLFNKASTLQGGQLNLSFKGNSKGANPHALMANVNGKAVVFIQNMTLLNKAIDSRQVDIFAAILKSIHSKKNETLFECVAVKLDFMNGIAKANRSVALETPDIYALGAGTLNLRTQILDFAFELQPRSNLNVEIGSIDHLVYLKGTLQSPQISMSPKGLIKEGGTLVLGVATGGLSVLAEKLYKVATKTNSPCKQVLNAS